MANINVNKILDESPTAGRLGGILGPPLLGVLMMMQLFNFVGLALPGLFAAMFIFLAQDRFGFGYRAGDTEKKS